jgi:hypothetical protein
MRNILFPKRRARYLDKDEIKRISEQHVSLSREHAYAPGKKADKDQSALDDSQASTVRKPDFRNLTVRFPFSPGSMPF